MELAVNPPASLTQPEMAEEFSEWIFTNDKLNPAIRVLNKGLYQGVFDNRVGMMHAKNKNTGEIETVIVGVVRNPDDGSVILLPMAVVLTEANVNDYLAPDGYGGFLMEDNDGQGTDSTGEDS